MKHFARLVATWTCAATVLGQVAAAQPHVRTDKGRVAASAPHVMVTGGQLRGLALAKGGAVFKGIPYAQPPVGNLRWREPMP
jgi:para-nitrobenzyl esterase